MAAHTQKRALITGVTGQDGAYLAQLLLNRGYTVFGTYRRVATPTFWRLQGLNILDKVTLIPADMADMASLLDAIATSKPDEVYNLAAQSFVGASFDQPLLTTEIDGSGAIRLLETIRFVCPQARFYQASTSELYGTVTERMQNERARFWPNSPYAAAKLLSYHNTRIYRECYGLFACNGILFNHESPLRGLEFVTRKVTNSAARIKLGLQDELRMGNLEAKRDWGFAPEYVEAMWLMLQQDSPDDYVIATGENHSVRELLDAAFGALGLDWQRYVTSDPAHTRPHDVAYLCGDASKAAKQLNWTAETKFHELIELMVAADLDRWQRRARGEDVIWDAPFYPPQTNIHLRKR